MKSLLYKFGGLLSVLLALPVGAVTYNGNGRYVALIDTGLNKDYAAISSKLHYEACFSQKDILSNDDPKVLHYKQASTCDAGKIKDTGSQASRIPRKTLHWNNFTNITNYYYFGGNHGSHVASVVHKTASGVKLDVINASYHFKDSTISNCLDHVTNMREDQNYSKNNCARFNTENIEEALQHIATLSNNVASVNLSLGKQSNDSCSQNVLFNEVQALVEKGIVVVAASGNDSTDGSGLSLPISWPACLSNVISVAAVHNDKVADYSNTWSGGVYGELDFWEEGLVSKYDGSGFVQGTSFAAPMVAAAYAILRQAKPTATVSEMTKALKATGKKIIDERNNIAAFRINHSSIQRAAEFLLKDDIDGNVDEQIGYEDTREYGPAYGDNVTQSYNFEIQFNANTSLTSTLEKIASNGAVLPEKAALSLASERDVMLRFVGREWLQVKLNGNIMIRDYLLPPEEAVSYVLNRNDFLSGSNIITIEPRDGFTGLPWGFKDITAEYTPQVPLTVGVKNTAQYGYHDSVNRYTRLRANFNLDVVDKDLEFTVTGWDIDRQDETAVFINSKFLGYLTISTNSGYNFGDRFVFSQADLAVGLNTIEFVQRRAGGSWWGIQNEQWAVKDMFLQALHPDLIMSSFELVDKRLIPNVPFSIKSKVKNIGSGSALATTVKYYLSSNKTIGFNDTQIGIKALTSMVAGRTISQSVSLSSPHVNKDFYIGACVAVVANESNTQNNCSAGVRLRSQITIAPIIMLLLGDD